MDQNISSYKAFFETAAAGNISKAALRLGISQPAVSKAITKLETGFGARLFFRTQRGVTLTPEGEVLYEHLENAFAEIEYGEEELKRLRDYKYGHLKIGSSTTLCSHFLSGYLRDFFEEYPYVKLTIENDSTGNTLNRLLGRKLDIGAVVLAENVPDIVFLEKMDVEDIFVCSPKYMSTLFELYGEDCSVFDKANIILLDKNHFSRKYIDSYLRTQGIVPKRVIEFPTLDLLIEMAKIGMGISSVIREFVTDELADGSLIEVPLGRPIPPRKAGFAYLESNTNPALINFLKSTDR